MPRLWPIALLLAAALAVAGCGDDERGDVEVKGGTDTARDTGTVTESTETTPSGAATATVRVGETEYELDPKNPKIAKAGLVAFKVTNAGQITHALEVEGPNGEQETEGIEPGGSATLKVDLGKAGRYEWYCPIGDHKERGMKGEITVAGGGSGAAEDNGGERTVTEEDSGSGRSGGSGGTDGGGRRSGASGGTSSGY